MLGGYIAPGALTLCLDESITTPLIIFPKVRKRNRGGEIGKLMERSLYHDHNPKLNSHSTNQKSFYEVIYCFKI